MKLNAVETAEIVAALARSLSPQAIGVVREIMNDSVNHPAVRLRAADMILTRAIGAAGRTLEDERNATVIFETVYDSPPVARPGSHGSGQEAEGSGQGATARVVALSYAPEPAEPEPAEPRQGAAREPESVALEAAEKTNRPEPAEPRIPMAEPWED